MVHTAVVTHDKALLWTDGRYFLQAEQELSAEWTLMKAEEPGVPTIEVRTSMLYLLISHVKRADTCHYVAMECETPERRRLLWHRPVPDFRINCSV